MGALPLGIADGTVHQLQTQTNSQSQKNINQQSIKDADVLLCDENGKLKVFSFLEWFKLNQQWSWVFTCPYGCALYDDHPDPVRTHLLDEHNQRVSCRRLSKSFKDTLRPPLKLLHRKSDGHWERVV